MIKKALGIFLIISLIIFLLTGSATARFDGNRTGNDDQFIIAYDMFNGTDSQVLRLEQGEESYEPETLMGYLWIKDSVAYIDKVEVITTEQQDRIEVLGLIAANDLPNGYYIYNETKEAVPFKLTNETLYHFTDIELKYSQDHTNRTYETYKVEEFRKASSYQDKPLEEQKIPYRFQVYKDEVISITEEFILTQ